MDSVKLRRLRVASFPDFTYYLHQTLKSLIISSVLHGHPEIVFRHYNFARSLDVPTEDAGSNDAIVK